MPNLGEFQARTSQENDAKSGQTRENQVVIWHSLSWKSPYNQAATRASGSST